MAFIQPDAAPSPEYDNDLDDLLHDAIAGITGLANELVRPRWQPEPPNQPDFNTNWAAFGVMDTDDDRFAHQRHDPDEGPEGSNIVSNDQTITVLHSFYGPEAAFYLNKFRTGMQIEQNREQLGAAGVKLVEFQGVTQLPALLKEKWVKRLDVRVVYRRRINRVYGVSTILSATAELDNEQYITPISVTNP